MNWASKDSAVLAWIVLIVLITSYVAAYDVWAWRSGHRMMTTQVRVWLTETVAGPLIAGLWVGVFVALTFHFVIRARK